CGMEFRLVGIRLWIGEDFGGLVHGRRAHEHLLFDSIGWPSNSRSTAVTVGSDIDDGDPTRTRSITPSHRPRILLATVSTGATTANAGSISSSVSEPMASHCPSRLRRCSSVCRSPQPCSSRTLRYAGVEPYKAICLRVPTAPAANSDSSLPVTTKIGADN